MNHFYKPLIAMSVAAFMTLGAQAEKGVVVIAKNGATTEISFPSIGRIDVGTTGLTLLSSDGKTRSISYADLDKVMIGQELSAVNNIICEGDIAVWPTCVSTTVNIAGIAVGTSVELYSLGGARVATAVAGSDNAASLDMTGCAPGVYIVSTQGRSVKIIKN